MNGWWWALIILVVYMIGVGGVFAYDMERHEQSCDACQRQKYCSRGMGGTIMLALFWPILPAASPLILGGFIGVWMAQKPVRRQDRERRAQLKHERDMEKIRARAEANNLKDDVIDVDFVP